MNLLEAIIVAVMLSTGLPVVAVVLRARSRRVLRLATFLAACAAAFFLFALLRVMQAGTRFTPTPWVYALIGSGVPVLLSGFLLSLVLGRDDPDEALRDSRRGLVFLGLFGLSMLFFMRRPSFVAGYDWIEGRGTIHLGSLGKLYVSYLMIGIMAVGYSLEKTYRMAPAKQRLRLRLPLIGLFGVLSYLTFVLVSGLLYSSIGLGKLVASVLPLALAAALVTFGYLRGGITDVASPVSRKVVYTSFTALAASVFVLAVGLAAQVATLTRWSPDEILIVAAGFVVALMALLFIFSHSFQRRVRRYVDRNFYVNRYDHQTQWSHLTDALEYATDREGLLERITPFLLEVFMADAVTISLRDDATHSIRPVVGKGVTDPSLKLGSESPLFRKLLQERGALLLDRKSDDFAYIPIYAENRGWLDATASQMVAPLLHASTLVGTIGLERSDPQDPFTFEDIALLDNMAAHVAATLRCLQLARELADSREMELMSQWSSIVLHDLKNYLSPLRMAASNLAEGRNDPEVAEACARDIEQVSRNMGQLVDRLSELRGSSLLGTDLLSPNEVVHEAVATLQVNKRPGIRVELDLKSACNASGDKGMLLRVVENLITNAIEAMDGGGTLSITTSDRRLDGAPHICVEVRDTGKGMTEEFMREKLFRPFATTKKKGLGLGLYQCRSIIRAHGGDISVQSELGKGSLFQIMLAAAGDPQIEHIGPVGASKVVRAEART